MPEIVSCGRERVIAKFSIQLRQNFLHAYAHSI
jgi:hypothetical protein